MNAASWIPSFHWPLRWSRSKAQRSLADRRLIVLAALRENLSEFDDARMRANAVEYDGANPEFIAQVEAGFGHIKKEAADASLDELDELVSRAESLSRLRAYVYPPSELELLAKTYLDEMRTWLVPETVINGLRTELLPLFSGDGKPEHEPERRAALCILFDYYDYWEGYVDDFAPFMRSVGVSLLAVSVALVAASLWAIMAQHVIVGFVCAGACGGVVSVLAKLPPLTIYGEWAAYVVTIVRRVGTGLAASVIGLGLLSSGLVSLPVAKGLAISEVLDACGGTTTAQISACLPSHVLLLTGLAMILGFSERALTSFNDKIFAVPSDSKGKPNNAGPAAS